MAMKNCSVCRLSRDRLIAAIQELDVDEAVIAALKQSDPELLVIETSEVWFIASHIWAIPHPHGVQLANLPTEPTIQ